MRREFVLLFAQFVVDAYFESMNEYVNEILNFKKWVMK